MKEARHPFSLPVVVSIVFGVVTASESFAQMTTSITSSGLNTQISAPQQLPSGQTLHDITGGTRPGGGTNLFHSFGEFSLGANNIANFLNQSGLPTTNILSRVTGGNPSSIFGTLQTTGFGNANIFLINPAGVIFGPTASLNVGGSVHVSTANYVKLADGTRFNAVPGPQDALLSIAPVEAFGFLGATLPAGQAGMITVQPGAMLAVPTGESLSLVGRDNALGVGQQAGIEITSGALQAEGGRIQLVSVGIPQTATGGEVDIAGSSTLSRFNTLGTVIVSGGAALTTSIDGVDSGLHAGTIIIRGGEFVLSDSAILADGLGSNLFVTNAGSAEIYASTMTLDRSTISASSQVGKGGEIIFDDVETWKSLNTSIEAIGAKQIGSDVLGRGGSITIGSTDTENITLTNSTVLATVHDAFASGGTLPPAGADSGDITITGRQVYVDGGTFDTSAGPHSLRLGGTITVNAKHLTISNYTTMTSMDTTGGSGGGTILFQGLQSTAITPTPAKQITINDSSLSVMGMAGPGGNIIFHADNVSLNRATLTATSWGFGGGGTINLSDVTNLRVVNSTLTSEGLSVGLGGDGGVILIGSPQARTIRLMDSIVSVRRLYIGANGGTINIRAARNFLSQGSTIDASSEGGYGGTISIRAGVLSLTNHSMVNALGAVPGQEGLILFEVGNKLILQDSIVTPDPTIISY